MWLQAVVTQEDLAVAFERLLPIRVDLDPDDAAGDRWLHIGPIASLEMIPGVGVKLSCGARIGYAVAGFHPELGIDSLTLRAKLSLEGERRDLLVLELHLDDADFSVLPAFVDHLIVSAVNRKLATLRLTWNFGQFLTRSFELPASQVPLDAISIGVKWGEAAVTTEGASLTISLELAFGNAPVDATADDAGAIVPLRA